MFRAVIKKIVITLLLSSYVSVIHAAGTPAGWQPNEYKIVNNQKVYEIWGGSLGAVYFLSHVAETSAKYRCEAGSALTGARNRPFSIDLNFIDENQLRFKCAGSPNSTVGRGAFVTKDIFRCPINSRLIFTGSNLRPGPLYCEEVPESLTPNKPPKTPPNSCDVGNPCQVSTGAKVQVETDFSHGLMLTRSYQTLNLVDSGFGKGWRSNFQQQIIITGETLYVIEQSGRADPWKRVNRFWQSDIDSDYILTEASTGFTITKKSGDINQYDPLGRLLSETDTQGKVTSYEYDTQGRLITISNHYQQSLTFTYSGDGKNHVIKVTDAQGVEYSYEYDTNDNLISVTFPDTNSDPSDNPKRIYHYENTNFPNHLTGITDANGNRFSTYSYDSNGKATSTEYSQTTNPVGQERFQLNYQN